jgi:LysM repeat protein
MNHDKDIEAALKRSRAAESRNDPPVEGVDTAGFIRTTRGRSAEGLVKPPRIDRLPPLNVQAPGQVRRGPTYPAWEKPPTQWNYPKLRGRDDHQTMKPLLLVAGLVAIVVVMLVAYQALIGGRGGTSAASGSPSHAASGSLPASANGSGQPSASLVASPTPGITDTPRPVGTFQKYKVQPGDSVAKVAAKYHLQRWELLLANPQITDPNVLKLGTTIYIPLPGQLTPSPAVGADGSDGSGGSPTPTVAAP